MANLSKNLSYNILLTVSGYIFPLLTFPYVTRVLGPESLGNANFALSLVDYAVLISTLGITTFGVKEIASSETDKDTLSEKFSTILNVHLLFAFSVLIVYLSIVFCTESLYDNLSMYLIGTIKILFNVFLIEWLFSGLQNFKYITVRSIITKILYVIAIFIFVRCPEDYVIYFTITVLQIALNALINWRYSKRYIAYKFTLKGWKNYVGSIFSLGITNLLLSFYSTFIVLYLGFVCGSIYVGYYTTATKLYAIILSVLSAFNGVFIPYLNAMHANKDEEGIKRTIEKLIGLVFFISLPLVAYSYVMAEQIILFISGEDFYPAIVPFQIIISQVLLVGVSQITEMQVLLTYNKTKTIFYITLSTVILSVLIMLLYAKDYGEIAAAYAVMIPHIFECVLLLYYARKCIKFKIRGKSLIYALLGSAVIGAECCVVREFINNNSFCLLISALFSFSSYLFLMHSKKDYFYCFIFQKIKMFKQNG